MSVYQQFFGWLLGGTVALGLFLLFSIRGRQHAVCCVALGQAFTVPVWCWTLEGNQYDVLFLPLVGALPTPVWQELGGDAASALQKAAQMGDVEGTGGINIMQALGLAGTGLTPLADFGAAAGGATLTGAAGAFQWEGNQNHGSSTGK